MCSLKLLVHEYLVYKDIMGTHPSTWRVDEVVSELMLYRPFGGYLYSEVEQVVRDLFAGFIRGSA